MCCSKSCCLGEPFSAARDVVCIACETFIIVERSVSAREQPTKRNKVVPSTATRVLFDSNRNGKWQTMYFNAFHLILNNEIRKSFHRIMKLLNWQNRRNFYIDVVIFSYNIPFFMSMCLFLFPVSRMAIHICKHYIARTQLFYWLYIILLYVCEK